MGSLVDFILRRKWHYVGRVEGMATYKDGIAYKAWLLHESNDGKRRASVSGEAWIESGNTLKKQIAVDTWLSGGPLPIDGFVPVHKAPEAKLVVFPGGRGAA